MNPLEKLKEKLMAKPIINEMKPVVVAVKRETKLKEESKINEAVELEDVEPKTVAKMIVIDETNKDYDRNAFLLKLAENKKTRVKVKPIMESVEATKQNEPIPTPLPAEQPPKKRAKKMVKKPLLIIEGDEEIENAEKPEKEARDAALEIIAE